ncbi:MAG: lipid-A-disaccharide synthase, partial [Odoribacter sp.]|nr:lipid-A-disaccharide synthase [Odoribacter sp.]
VRKIRKYVDRMYVIFPFETDFYKKYGYKAEYEGNPLVDAIHGRAFQEETFEQFAAANRLPAKPVIALLAGSRSQELKHVLPKMLEMTDYFTDYQFVIAGAPSMTEADYAPYLKGKSIPVVYGQTYRLLQQSVVALVTSGTATLETAILKVPQVVCYSGEGGSLSYLLFKIFVKVKYISLVNLIMGREVVKELLMQKLNRRNLRAELTALLEQAGVRERMLSDYEEVNRRLGTSGASRRFAARMVAELRTK